MAIRDISWCQPTGFIHQNVAVLQFGTSGGNVCSSIKMLDAEMDSSQAHEILQQRMHTAVDEMVEYIKKNNCHIK